MTKFAIIAGLLVTTAAFAYPSTAEVETDDRDIDGFNQVRLEGSVDADITVGKSFDVKVVADSDVIDRVLTEVEGSTLVVKLERGSYRNIEELRVEIAMPKMTGGAISGSGDMTIEGLKGQDFDFDLKGSGDAEITGKKLKAVAIDLRGSGDIELEGDCKSIDIDLRGSGDIEGADFECTDAVVDLRGSGDISVHADGNVDVSLKGSGDVDVHGKPKKLNTKARGSGDINVR